MINLNDITRFNNKDSRYINAAKEIIEDELANYWNADSESEKQYLLSVIYKNLQILKGNA